MTEPVGEDLESTAPQSADNVNDDDDDDDDFGE